VAGADATESPFFKGTVLGGGVALIARLKELNDLDDASQDQANGSSAAQFSRGAQRQPNDLGSSVPSGGPRRLGL
jgi:hypothetical protein